MLSKQAKVLLIGGGFWYFGEGLFGPLLAIFTTQVGGDILDLSWAWSAYLIVYGILSIIFGKLADGYIDKGKLMVFGYALNAFFTFGYLFVSDALSLFIVQAGLGVAAALATPTWNALFDEFSDKSINGYAWGIAEGVASVITGISIIIGALVVSYASFATLFTVMGLIQTLATLFQARILYMSKRVARKT